MENNLKNKWVLITGASSGIGKVFAERFASLEANLVLTARREDRLQELSDRLISEKGIQVKYLPLDLSEPDAPQKLFDFCEGIEMDTLVNNAGFGDFGLFDATSFDTNRKMIRLNIESLTLLTHLFLPGMLKRKSGSVINLASTASFQPIPYLGVYAATKAYVRSFSEALWEEYRDKGIYVLCLCPGNTTTEFHQSAHIKEEKVFLEATAEDLVDFGMKHYMKRKHPTVVHGAVNKILAFSRRLNPKRTSLSILRRIYESRH